MDFDIDGHVAGENLVWAGIGIAVALLYGPRVVKILYRLGPRAISDRRMNGLRLMAGIALVGLGGAVHRTYWAVWRILDRPDVLVDWAMAASLPSVVLVTAGYLLHLYPWLRDRWPRRWPVAFLGFVGALYGAGFLGA